MEPRIEPEPVPEPIQEFEIMAEPEDSQVIVETQRITPPVEPAAPGEPTAHARFETEPIMEKSSRHTGGAVAPVDLPPAYTHNPKPAYPRAARRLGQEGEVLLLVEILASGRVGKIDIEKSSGYDILDDAAVKAVRKWRFAPARKGKTTVNAWVRVPVEFSLKDRR